MSESKVWLERAMMLKGQNLAMNEEDIWWSLHEYGRTLEDPERIGELLVFMDGTIETRQAVMQVIFDVFKKLPPKNFESIEKISERIAVIAEKFLDPDVVVSPQNASLGLNAFLACVVMGSPKAVDCAARIKGLDLGVGFILRRSIRLIDEAVDNWVLMKEFTEYQMATMKNMKLALEALKKS